MKQNWQHIRLWPTLSRLILHLFLSLLPDVEVSCGTQCEHEGGCGEWWLGNWPWLRGELLGIGSEGGAPYGAIHWGTLSCWLNHCSNQYFLPVDWMFCLLYACHNYSRQHSCFSLFPMTHWSLKCILRDERDLALCFRMMCQSRNRDGVPRPLRAQVVKNTSGNQWEPMCTHIVCDLSENQETLSLTGNENAEYGAGAL